MFAPNFLEWAAVVHAATVPVWAIALGRDVLIDRPWAIFGWLWLVWPVAMLFHRDCYWTRWLAVVAVSQLFLFFCWPSIIITTLCWFGLRLFSAP